MIPRFIAKLLRPVQRLLLRLVPVSDPWERIDVRPALHQLASGSRYDFEWYFEGESAVPVSNLYELRCWLRGCRYVRDHELFHERDYWQHPRTFEQLRRGDCEDFALWAWRKLVELDYDADLVIGSRPGNFHRWHAWVVYRHEGSEYLMEPSDARNTDWVRPLKEVQGEYVPFFGVGRDRRRFTFAGYLLFLQRRAEGGASTGMPPFCADAERPSAS